MEKNPVWFSFFDLTSSFKNLSQHTLMSILVYAGLVKICLAAWNYEGFLRNTFLKRNVLKNNCSVYQEKEVGQ